MLSDMNGIMSRTSTVTNIQSNIKGRRITRSQDIWDVGLSVFFHENSCAPSNNLAMNTCGNYRRPTAGPTDSYYSVTKNWQMVALVYIHLLLLHSSSTYSIEILLHTYSINPVSQRPSFQILSPFPVHLWRDTHHIPFLMSVTIFKELVTLY